MTKLNNLKKSCHVADIRIFYLNSQLPEGRPRTVDDANFFKLHVYTLDMSTDFTGMCIFCDLLLSCELFLFNIQRTAVVTSHMQTVL